MSHHALGMDCGYIRLCPSRAGRTVGDLTQARPRRRDEIDDFSVSSPEARQHR
jgi:hypothetical protein